MRLLYVLVIVALTTFSCKDGGGSSDTLANGYKYTHHVKNDGLKPVSGQVVTLDFQLTTAEGKVLDDSRLTPQNKPAMTIPPEEDKRSLRNPMLAMIKQMATGDSATIIVPLDSLPNPPEEYKGTEHINYIVKVNSIEEVEVYKKRMQEEQMKQQAAAKFKEEAASKEIIPMFDDYMAGKFKSKTKTLDNGLKVTIVDDKGGSKPVIGDEVTVQYYGFLKDGTSFDNSYKAGRAFTFKIGSRMVIQGWELGLPEITKGSKAMVEIPYDLAYGPQGKPPVIPEKADLIFFIELEKINNK